MGVSIHPPRIFKKRGKEKMEKLVLKAYDDEDNVIKEAEAKMIDLRFGTVRSLMELLNVDEIEDTAEVLKKVVSAWKQITKILSRVFPTFEDEDWENVKLTELVPLLVFILKDSFVQMLQIPTESKN